MKNLFGFPLYAVCCILSICMPVNLVSSGVGLKGNWPTVQCTIQQYRLEKNGQLRMQYGPVFFQCPLVNVTRNVSFSLLPSRAVCLTSMHTGGNLLAILSTKSALYLPFGSPTSQKSYVTYQKNTLVYKLTVRKKF